MKEWKRKSHVRIKYFIIFPVIIWILIGFCCLLLRLCQQKQTVGYSLRTIAIKWKIVLLRALYAEKKVIFLDATATNVFLPTETVNSSAKKLAVLLLFHPSNLIASSNKIMWRERIKITSFAKKSGKINLTFMQLHKIKWAFR